MALSESLGEDITIVLTLLLLEAVLSFDNAAILAAMVWKLPMADRRKALLYGLVGAYALRTGAILLASFLIDNPSFKLLGGGYLLYIALNHFWKAARHKEGTHKAHELKTSGGIWKWLGVPALVAVIIQIELIDLAFAIDQVVVAVAFTDKVPLIIIASMLGILFLRIAAAYIAKVMDWLPLLEHMAYVAVGYVGIKLMLLYPFFAPGGECIIPALTHVQHGAAMCEIPTAVSVTMTMGLFGIPVLVKTIFNWPESRPGSHSVASSTTPPVQQPTQAGLQAAHAEVKSGRREIDGVPEPAKPPPER